MSIKKIIIYNDSPIFGGHEIMTAEIANLLVEKYEVSFMFYNPSMEEVLKNQINKIQIDISSRLPLAGLRSFNIKDIYFLRKLIKKEQPDLAIISQGTIELSLKGALASKLLGIRTVSYIPLCYPSSQLGIGFAGIRDILNKQFYRLFDAFITISAEQKVLIKKWNKNAKVFVLPNLVKFQNNLYNDCEGFQFSFGEAGSLRIGVVGRILFKQKGQDKLIEIAEFLRRNGLRFTIFVIGDGPDRKKLEDLARKKDLNKFFVFTGWIKDRSKIYNMIDLLLITSNFEGVPLNMLEALSACKPVLAPAKGVFKEYLPDTFLYQNDVDIMKFISKLFSDCTSIINSLRKVREKIYKLHNKETFSKTLFSIINTLYKEKL